jgi:hypothetical protein
MVLSFKERRNVVAYKRAYIALRLSHAAMLRGDSEDYTSHYRLEQARSEAAERLQAHIVAAIEQSVDKAFGWPLEGNNQADCADTIYKGYCLRLAPWDSQCAKCGGKAFTD